MRRSICVTSALALGTGVASSIAFSTAQELRYAGAEGATLYTVADEERSPRLANLEHGAAVLVEEIRDGFARVVVRGWVPVEALTERAPVEGAMEAAESASPNPTEAEQPDATGDDEPAPAPRAADVAEVQSFDLDVHVDPDAHVVELSLVLLDEHDRSLLVSVEEGEARIAEFELELYQERVLAAGHVKGRRLLHRTVELLPGEFDEDGVRPISLELDDWNEEMRWLRLILRLRPADGRLLMGTLREIPVPAGEAEDGPGGR